MEKYLIHFSGVKPGMHSFDFNPDTSFFGHFDFPDIICSDIRVHIDMEKEEHMLIFRIFIQGNAELVCDRCGDPLTEALDGQEKLVVKLSDHNEEESEDVLIVKESDGKFDISQLLYEYIRLMLPAHRVHGEDKNGKSLCNPDIIKKLNELNRQRTPDPRWEVLGRLRNKTDQIN